MRTLTRRQNPQKVLTDEEQARHRKRTRLYSDSQIALLDKLVAEGLTLYRAAKTVGMNYESAKRLRRKFSARLNTHRLEPYKRVIQRADQLERYYPEKSFRKRVLMAAPLFGLNAQTVMTRYYEGLLSD